MKKIDVKQIRYSYGKFYVKGWKEDTRKDKLLIKSVSGESLNPSVDNYYIFSDTVNNLTVNLPSVNSNYVELFKIQLTTGDAPNIAFVLDGDTLDVDFNEWETATSYEISCVYISLKWTISITRI